MSGLRVSAKLACRNDYTHSRLLLLEQSDVVYGLTLGVLAFRSHSHCLPVLGDDSSEDLGHRAALLVSAFCRPCVDSLERHRVGDLGPGERIVLAVEIGRV